MKTLYRTILCSLYLICLDAYGQSKDPAQYFSNGEKSFRDNLYDEAFVNFKSAAQAFATASNDTASLKSITRAGQCLIRMRRIDEGISLLTQYEPLAEKIDLAHEVRENFLNVLSELHYHAGDAFNSLRYHQKVYDLNMARGNLDPEKHITLVRIMGVLYGNSGQLKNAIDYYTSYAELISKHHGSTHLLMSDAFNYLGVMYRHMGEYDMSIDYYQKSIDIAERYTAEERAKISPRFRSVAPVYNNIGTVHHYRDDHENALRYTLKALSLYERDNAAGKSSLGTILTGLGTTYTKLDRHREALEYKQKALQMYIAEYGDRHGRVATELRSIGDTYFEMRDYAVAEDYYKRALEMNLATHGRFHPNTSETYVNIANIEEAKGNLDGALTNIQTAIQCLVSDFNSDKLYDNPNISAMCNVKIHLVERLGKKADLMIKVFERTSDERLLHGAHETYDLAVRFAEVVRNDLLDNRSKAYLSANSKSLYEKSIRTALRLHSLTGDPRFMSVAFRNMEKNKSRLLLESLQTSQIKSTLAANNELFNKENGLQSQIAWIEEQILDERIKGDTGDSAKVTRLNEQLFETRRELEAFKRTLQSDNPKYYSAKYATPEISPALIQEKLDANELFVEYFTGDSLTYVFYVTSEKTGFLTISNPIIPEIQDLLTSIRNRDADRYMRIAYPLYQKLLEPAVRAADAAKEKITIVPDGIVSYLPFELLLTSVPAQNKFKTLPYAIRKHNFGYHLSATLMLKDKSSDQERLQFAGFAPKFDGPVIAQRGLPGNIPYAQREVADISSSFKGMVYVGDDATESNFRKHAGSATLLHLATHASRDDRDANLSHLYFAASDSVEDGLLHTYEIFNLQLKADLITLSACNTAAGQFKEGEGVMSLSRAFAYAGCESMVTSLWPSQDQTTADIMADFYKNLANGASKDAALRQAKLTFLENSDNIKSDPFFWAGFVLIGNPEPLDSGPGATTIAYAASVAVLLILSVFGFLRWRYRRIAEVSE